MMVVCLRLTVAKVFSQLIVVEKGAVNSIFHGKRDGQFFNVGIGILEVHHSLESIDNEINRA